MDERAKYKKSLAILISIAIIVIIAATAIVTVLLVKNKKSAKYYEATRKAESCIKDMNYTEAIKEYEKALTFDDSKPEIYEKLAVLYEQQGDYEKAKTYVVRGYKITKNPELSTLIDTINLKGTTGYTFEDGSSVLVTYEDVRVGDKKYGKVIFKNTISDQVLNYTIDDYIDSYGMPEFYDEGDCSVADFGSIRVLYPSYVSSIDRARDYEGDPVGVQMSDLSMIFDGVIDDIDFDTVCDSLEGTPDVLYDDVKGIYYISIVYLGCRIDIECDINGNLSSDAGWIFISNANPYIVSEEEEDDDSELELEINAATGSLSGKIRDAVSGAGISNVHLVFRKGSSQKTGETAGECDTDSNGNYFIELEDGNYTVEIKKTGYIDHYETLQVIKNVSRTGQDLVISTQMAGQIRIVLQWGGSPSDLDSHLTGSTDSGTSLHVSYREKIFYGGNGKIAELDVDDRDGYGPETTTIYDINGVYEFDVVDYTESGTMSSSGAKVTIYLPDNSSQTISINSGVGSSNTWHVLKIDHGKVTVLNY